MFPTVTIDIGTTSVKLCAFDADGEPLASARHATPTMQDQWGEIYDVERLKQGIASFVQDLDFDVRASVRAITIAGVGESGGLVRPDLTLASPMILWHDHRGAKYLAPLDDAARTLIYRTSGLPVNANYALSKVAWAVAHAGAAAGAQWLNISEYIAAWMTGQRWSEPSLASRTMALELTSSSWSADVCGLVGVDTAVFPQLRAASEGTTITAEFAKANLLVPGVMVHVAGHDHMVGAVGAGLRTGELLNSTGTTEGILYLRESPSVNDRAQRSQLANGLACVGSTFTLFASIPTGGSAFSTLQTMLALSGHRLVACLNELHVRYMAQDIDWTRVPLVLPQFRGSPPPRKQASARGVITGIASNTTMEDIVFGCFVGMAMQFRDVLDLFDTPLEKVKVIGPASSNDLWLQLKADLLGTQLSVSDFPEVVSRGAQALASNALPEWESCQPREVLFDDQRAKVLHEWCEQNSSRWEYAKNVPT